MLSFDNKFSGVPTKNISFTATLCWNSINSSWILAASTSVVSSCRSSAPPPSVHDESLSTNISENAQQSSGTYQISTSSLVHSHTCACLLFHLEIRYRVVNGLHFEARHLFSKTDLSLKANSTKWVKICETAVITKCSVQVQLQVPGFITPKIATALTKTLA